MVFAVIIVALIGQHSFHDITLEKNS